MKRIIILILFIFTLLPAFAEEKIDIFSSSDSKAAKILYDFVLKDQNVSSQKAFELFGYNQSNVSAMFYDLDSDGVNEIIGVIYANYFYCVQGYELFILKKENNVYKRITYVHFFPEGNLYILDSKTAGYFDLKVHHTRINSFSKPEYHVKLSDAFSFVKYNPKEQYYMYDFSD